MEFEVTTPHGGLRSGIYEIPIKNSDGSEVKAIVSLGDPGFFGCTQTFSRTLYQLAANSPCLTLDVARMEECSSDKVPAFFLGLPMLRKMVALAKESETAKLPSMVDSPTVNTDFPSNKSCAICLADFLVGDKVARQSCCKQVLHFQCLQLHLQSWTANLTTEGSVKYFSCAFCRGCDGFEFGRMEEQGMVFDLTGLIEGDDHSIAYQSGDVEPVSQVTSTSDGSTIPRSASLRRSSAITQFTDFVPDSEDTETFLGRSFIRPRAEALMRRYWLPIDQREGFRQKLCHILWLSQQILVMPEIDRETNGVALDLGTGCGFWVQDVSQKFPQLQVIGVDLHYDHVPEAPGNSWFLRADCEDETDRWPNTDPVVLINLRDSFWWLRDNEQLCRRTFQTLREGGWFLNQEIHIRDWHSNKARVEAWRDQTLQCASSLELPLPSHVEIKTALLAAGFDNVHEDRRTCSTVEGAEIIDLVKSTVWATRRMLVEGGQCSPDQVDHVLSGVTEELDQADTCVEIAMCALWAQKPVRVTCCAAHAH